MKKIEHILYGREKKITEEETVRQPLPHKDFRFANPFIVLHHAGPAVVEAGQELRIHPIPIAAFHLTPSCCRGKVFTAIIQATTKP
ncbi:hypothetical protein [Paraflavitalea speifideaquila]|uniref:hypothetical protein n=1 Tax=Paraflavitalea speifideaquila TaxID=3076558 RepID=UPI0028E24020|nr:hypothetical protein [Paraflavitalea speifideiaquila]